MGRSVIVACLLLVGVAISPAFAGRGEPPGPNDPNSAADIVGDCGFANGGLGCSDPTCEACVCGIDPFCCNVAWDGICAGEASNPCGEDCSGEPSVRNIISTPALGPVGKVGLILAVLGVGTFFLRRRGQLLGS